MGTVAQHQVTTFVNPANGQSPIDATIVRGNDNTIRASYNTHDADPTIHVQNGIVSTRPSASVAGQMWLSSDPSAVYLYLDTGSAWVEANYLRSTGGTISGPTTITGLLSLGAELRFTAAGATLQGTTAGNVGVNLFALTSDVTRFYAGVDANGFQWTNQAASTEWMRLVGGVLTVASGVVVAAGGVTITAGGATVTLGDLVVTAGFGRFGSMATTNATAPTLCLTSTTAPTGNPVGGGFLYVVNGVLVYRGPGGTITTLAVS